MDYTDKILFIEDIGELEYSIDRMMHLLKRSGKLAKLMGKGVFNKVEVPDIPFESSPQDVIWEIVKEHDYPVCFNFQVDHLMTIGQWFWGISQLSSQERKVYVSIRQTCE